MISSGLRAMAQRRIARLLEQRRSSRTQDGVHPGEMHLFVQGAPHALLHLCPGVHPGCTAASLFRGALCSGVRPMH